MDYYLLYMGIFLLVFGGVLLVFAVIHNNNMSEIEKRQRNLNQKLFEHLREINFNTTKTIHLNDYATFNKGVDSKKIISVDNENKKVALVDYEKQKMFIVNFQDILSYEIYENGSNSTIGGNVGGFFGGIFSAETNGMCKDLKLIIRLNSYENAQIVYNIISNTTFNMGLNKSTKQYMQGISSLQEVVSFLEVVKNENRTNINV
ncbi:MAG: hypothetical protein IKA72_00455 [Clostridia bacterium]|nr:hypothetical protein [Clostridia bacterium]